MGSLNNAAFAHRIAIALRFAERVDKGNAVFLQDSFSFKAMPYTETGESKRSFSGMNAFMLMQVMQDNGWLDARFFTAAQVAQSGWTLQPDAKPVVLQFLTTIGNDGLPLEKPVVKRFRVFNASEIVGVPNPKHERQVSSEDLIRAASAAGYPIIENALSGTLEKWLMSVDDVSQSTLPIRLAGTLLQAQTGFSFVGAPAWHETQQWVQSIRENPMAFFDMARQAHVITAHVMQQIELAGIERLTEKALAEAATNIDGQVVELTKIKSDKGVAMVRKASSRVEEMYQQRAGVLSVPFKHKDRASQLGAVFYPPQSIWFVPKGMSLEPFREWDARTHSLGAVASTQALLDSFANAMKDLGLQVPSEIVADAKWHNVPVNTKSKNTKNKAGSYILSLTGARDGGAIGTVINKDTGERFTWKYDGPLLTPEQRARLQAETREREARAEREMIQAQDRAAVHANEIWILGEAADTHGYVIKKGISAEGLRQVLGTVLMRYDEFKGESGKSIIRAKDNYLIVPMTNENGELRAVQAISPDGVVKSFMRGAQKKGTMCVLGAESLSHVAASSTPAVAYAEGIATGASIYAGSSLPVIVCFDASNMETVVPLTAAMLPPRMSRMLAVDNDQFFVERALGFLATNVGLNPHASGTESVSVANGRQVRAVSVGEMKADGRWHETAQGSYCASCVYEEGDEVVRSMVVEVVPKGEKRIRATFDNRGLEAGRTAIASISDLVGKGKVTAAPTFLVVPEFTEIEGRPTDYNDLAKKEGLNAVRQQLEAGGAILPVLAQRSVVRTSERLAVGIGR